MHPSIHLPLTHPSVHPTVHKPRFLLPPFSTSLPPSYTASLLPFIQRSICPSIYPSPLYASLTSSNHASVYGLSLPPFLSPAVYPFISLLPSHLPVYPTVCQTQCEQPLGTQWWTRQLSWGGPGLCDLKLIQVGEPSSKEYKLTDTRLLEWPHCLSRGHASEEPWGLGFGGFLVLSFCCPPMRDGLLCQRGFRQTWHEPLRPCLGAPRKQGPALQGRVC